MNGRETKASWRAEKELHDLTPPELILLQKHVELGKDHLVELLGEKGFLDLLRWTKPNQQIIEKNKADDTEISGNLVLTVNTIITGCFGGWMGLSAIMEFNLHSAITFAAVFSFATLTGAWMGYQNFQSTKIDAIQDIQALQMIQFEIDILNKIRQIREQELREIETELLSFSPTKQKICLDWFATFEQIFEENLSPYQGQAIYRFLKNEIEDIKREIRKNLEESLPQREGAEIIYQSKEHQSRNLSPFIRVMISSYPTESKNSKSWIRRNARKILISLIPTLIGGFGSMFVYLSGTTEIAKAFEYNHLVSLLTSPHSKYIKLTLAFLFTTYFGFSFLYSNRKAYKRSRELETKKESISKEESSLSLLDEQLLKLRKVHEGVNKIRKLIEMAEEKS